MNKGEWNRDDIINELKKGNSIECYKCPTILKWGDHCVVKSGKVYCMECGANENDMKNESPTFYNNSKFTE